MFNVKIIFHNRILPYIFVRRKQFQLNITNASMGTIK